MVLVQGARGLIVAGLAGLAFTLVAGRDLPRARAERGLPPGLRVALLTLGPAAMGVAAGGAVEATYVGAALGAAAGLASCVVDRGALPPRRGSPHPPRP